MATGALYIDSEQLDDLARRCEETRRQVENALSRASNATGRSGAGGWGQWHDARGTLDSEARGLGDDARALRARAQQVRLAAAARALQEWLAGLDQRLDEIGSKLLKGMSSLLDGMNNLGLRFGAGVVGVGTATFGALFRITESVAGAIDKLVAKSPAPADLAKASAGILGLIGAGLAAVASLSPKSTGVAQPGGMRTFTPDGAAAGGAGMPPAGRRSASHSEIRAVVPLNQNSAQGDRSVLDRKVKFIDEAGTARTESISAHIKRYGCTMTSWTMLLNSRGYNVDQAEMYQKLHEAKIGAWPTGSDPIFFDDLNWSHNAVAIATGNGASGKSGTLSGTTAGQLVTSLTDAVVSQRQVVLAVSGTGIPMHWVLVTKVAADGQVTYFDPLTGKERTGGIGGASDTYRFHSSHAYHYLGGPVAK